MALPSEASDDGQIVCANEPPYYSNPPRPQQYDNIYRVPLD